MINIADLLQQRITTSDLRAKLRDEGKEYQKKYALAVQCFQTELNKERDTLPPLSFMAVRSKVEHIREIQDLRWFYGKCLLYKRKKKDNTFSKFFFGALKIRTFPQQTHRLVDK